MNRGHGSVRDLEHPLIKVPYEQLNLTFRNSQKSVEKDLSVVQKAVKELGKKKNVGHKEAGEYLGKVVQKLRGVKRKVCIYFPLLTTSWKKQMSKKRNNCTLFELDYRIYSHQSIQQQIDVLTE
jgi:hypothetical protein